MQGFFCKFIRNYPILPYSFTWETKKFIYECYYLYWAARDTSLLHHSILIILLIPCSLVLFSLHVLHTLWCRLVCRNSVNLSFLKTELKSELGYTHNFFLWAMSIHVHNKIHQPCPFHSCDTDMLHVPTLHVMPRFMLALPCQCHNPWLLFFLPVTSHKSFSTLFYIKHKCAHHIWTKLAHT